MRPNIEAAIADHEVEAPARGARVRGIFAVHAKGLYPQLGWVTPKLRGVGLVSQGHPPRLVYIGSCNRDAVGAYALNVGDGGRCPEPNDHAHAVVSFSSCEQQVGMTLGGVTLGALQGRP